MRRGWLVALGLLIAFGGWHSWSQRGVARGDGILAPDEPVQAAISTPVSPLAVGDARLAPLATFSLTAHVLAREDYRFDAGATLSPTDLALGWGRMSDSAVLSRLDIEQHDRFYFWRADTLPIPRREIETHSANMHLIPAGNDVARRLRRVRAGDLVTFDGWLVEADRPNGWRWRSSLTRDDTGAGACELVYVRDLSIGAR